MLTTRRTLNSFRYHENAFLNQRVSAVVSAQDLVPTPRDIAEVRDRHEDVSNLGVKCKS